MRWLLMIGLVGCTGGQTGEITRLSELALEMVRMDDSVEERGFDACLHWRAAIEVDASTIDGRLDTTLSGSLDVRESGTEIRARTTRSDGIELTLELFRDDSGVHGTLWEKSDPELDDELVATW